MSDSRFHGLMTLGMPAELVDIIEVSPVSHLATATMAGAPITDAIVHVPGLGTSTIDVRTGLAYSVKAERARRHPDVGMLFDGSGEPGSPLAIVAGSAAVLDHDLQANTERWVRDGFSWVPEDKHDLPWENAVWYWVSVYIATTPTQAWWWPDGDLSKPPARWRRPDRLPILQSDPAPPGKVSRAAQIEPLAWEAEATRVLAGDFPPPTLTTLHEGVPIPVRSWEARRTTDGFELRLPDGTPWRAKGKAFVGFVPLNGVPTGVAGRFIGEVTGTDGPWTQVAVSRALPPAHLERLGPDEYLFPPPADRAELMRRLTHELDRRGAAMPVVRRPETSAPPVGPTYG